MSIDLSDADDVRPLLSECVGMMSGDDGSHTWKIRALESNTEFDFDYLVHVQKVLNGAYKTTLIVPQADGRLLRYTTFPVFQNVTETTSIKTIKASHGSFGPVSVQKLMVRVYYEGLSRTVFTTKFLRSVHDKDGTPLAAAQPVNPPLPALLLLNDTPTVRGLSPLLSDFKGTDSLGSIWFPSVSLRSDGDYDVDGGEEIETPAEERRSGIYVDTLVQDVPLLTLSVYVKAEPGQPLQTLFGDYCTVFRREAFKEHVFKKKRRSWFRTKTTIRIVRKNLRSTQIECGTLE